MKFNVEITCDNDAFEPSDVECDAEVARILRELAEKIDGGGNWTIDAPVSRPLRDINGNYVGFASYSGKAP